MSILTKRCAVATFVISTIIVSDVIGQRYVSAISKSAESSGFAFTDADTVRGHLMDVMRELEYPDAVANEFVNMVSDWKDIKGRPALVAYSSILTRSQEACKRGQISGSQLAEIEEGITKELGECIRKEVSYKRNHFDLADVIQGERANCLGYSQIFYVLGNSIRLSVHAIRVTPGHIANIVDLSDETMTVVDLTRADGFISERIITESEFEGRGSRWRLADKNNLVREDKTIHILDKNELVGEIYFCRGTICYLSSQGSTAIPHYNRAIELNPASAKAYNNRGGAYLALGEQAKAVSDFNKALELNPEYASAYQNLANAYLDSGQHTAAVTDYTSLRRISDGDSHILRWKNTSWPFQITPKPSN